MLWPYYQIVTDVIVWPITSNPNSSCSKNRKYKNKNKNKNKNKRKIKPKNKVHFNDVDKTSLLVLYQALQSWTSNC